MVARDPSVLGVYPETCHWGFAATLDSADTCNILEISNDRYIGRYLQQHFGHLKSYFFVFALSWNKKWVLLVFIYNTQLVVASLGKRWFWNVPMCDWQIVGLSFSHLPAWLCDAWEGFNFRFASVCSTFEVRSFNVCALAALCTTVCTWTWNK